ncbi:putative resolvase (plasmid) [Corynebacterium maris DSM 45190]|uniref:Putative resolvase n=1 Tax=Corynebacterium maris DSM 45190 TaxID=1224163 RepID=S5SXS4_9CORY|nr:recombinase family protein [Corynebacterium maris]AGS36044.1 putative resolvase [Corynebacterium maris DSM 45190]
MARPGTLLNEDLRTPQEEIRIVRKHKHATTIQRRVQRGHRWVWDSTAEKVATERVLDDDAARWRAFENNPKLATWHSTLREPQALVKIHRSYKFVTKAQVYYGRDDTGATRWGEIEEISSPDVVRDGGAGWGFHPPAWETTPDTSVEEQNSQADENAVDGRTDTAAAATKTNDQAVAPEVDTAATPAPAADPTPAPTAPAPPPTGQKVSYLRVSSKDQSIARQREALAHLGIRKEFIDEISARSRADRPGLEACLEYLRDGDELHVASIDRLARSLIDLKELVTELTTQGVTVVFHKEGLRFAADTDDPTANLMLGVLGSFAEFERAIIRERQAEGIALAKKAGKYTGRPKALSEEQVADARRRITAGESKTSVAKALGVGRSTLYRYL